MKKTVTVAIPVYNGEKYILDALDSIVNQTLKMDKILICDNCSFDNTIPIIDKFIDEHPEFDIELIKNKENIGYQKNFIKCYDKTKTDYLVTLHVDDLLKHDALECQVNFLNKNSDVAAVGGKADSIDSEGHFIDKSLKTKDLLFKKNEIHEFIEATGSYLPFSSVMYNLKLTRDITYLEKESVGEDELYWPTLLQKHPIAILGKSLIENRIHEDQMHVSLSINKFEEYKKHFKYLLDIEQLEKTAKRQKKAKKILKEHVSHMSINIGKNIMQHTGKIGIASKYYIYGIKQNNRIIFSKFFLKSILSSFKLYK